MDVQQIKQRFGIIGNAPLLNRALEVAAQVAPTDISVLVMGESGTGKEIIPQVIHQLSARKHGAYIAVNCGAIPEGTIDSELFGHEKGSFTGATGSRDGYFQVADGGTIFLDEVAELPMQTQVRLLRVLETGEFIKVGSSKVIKTNVRVVAATNENMQKAVQSGKFREDLLYRLSTVPIYLPPLRERKDDIHLLFRKFASDFADKYKMPMIRLTESGVLYLQKYTWQGNIRQLKNLVEQLSVIEKSREIDAEILNNYLDVSHTVLPNVVQKSTAEDNFSERELMYKFLFEMKNDLNELKKLVSELITQGDLNLTADQTAIVNRMYTDTKGDNTPLLVSAPISTIATPHQEEPIDEDINFDQVIESDYQVSEKTEDNLSLEEIEKKMILKALEKHRGKRKYAADDLGISERTLYRKIKEYNLNE
ncbi:MAG TPA: sigma-54 dependent transcriptional regulator [Crocinitomicaceae bacterium]|nr:sigma-54 dependent transcriptional regulator [Crocinitomicaceae bacterium]